MGNTINVLSSLVFPRAFPLARHSDIVDRFNMGTCWLLLAVGLVAAVVVPARFLDGSSGQCGSDSRGVEYGILDVGDVVSQCGAPMAGSD